MQRGAAQRDREPPEPGYPGLKIEIASHEQRQFDFGQHTEAETIARLGPTIRQYARGDVRKPSDVCRLLNRANIRTACGERWTPRLTAFLLSLVYTGSPNRTLDPKPPKPGSNPGMNR